jgi:5-methylcytosine-specific restriction endonuclease McrA
MTSRALPSDWQAITKRIIARDGGVCSLCGKPGANSADHVIPRSRGGSHADTNLRAAHLRCNQVKGTRGVTITLPRANVRSW